MPRGNADGPRGHRTRVRFSLTAHKDAARALKLIAWGRYGRPTTDEETEAVLAAIIEEERQRALAAAPAHGA